LRLTAGKYYAMGSIYIVPAESLGGLGSAEGKHYAMEGIHIAPVAQLDRARDF
jgi:hypothetical protein